MRRAISRARALLGGAAALPLATSAQQPGKVWRIGFGPITATAIATTVVKY
jgi:hypothetical protein